MKKGKNESSTMTGGNVVGFQGKKPKMKKGQLKVSQPFDEVVAIKESLEQDDDEEMEEVVKKKGNQWVFYDDETGVQHGAYSDRETAWEVQRRQRALKKAKREKERKEKERSVGPKVNVDPSSVDKRKRERPSYAPKREAIEKIKQIIKESYMTYMFEQTPTSKDAVAWEKFLEKLSRETVMSDPKLKSILQKSIKAEADVLNKAVSAIKSILEKTGSFKIKEKGVEKDGETRRIKSTFIVHMKENNQDLLFSVIVENGRPLIMFPDESKNTINQLANNESKLLRAELMHAQETALDQMVDVTTTNEKRNKYLESLQSKVDGMLDGLNLLELSMVRYLIKTKYKGVG